MLARLQISPPTTRAWVTFAGTIGVQNDSGNSGFRRFGQSSLGEGGKSIFYCIGFVCHLLSHGLELPHRSLAGFKCRPNQPHASNPLCSTQKINPATHRPPPVPSLLHKAQAAQTLLRLSRESIATESSQFRLQRKQLEPIFQTPQMNGLTTLGPHPAPPFEHGVTKPPK